MKAIVCSEFGPIESLQFADVEPQPLSKSQVRIEVHACGINFPDVLILEGKYQVRPPLPFHPGGEVAGVVMEVGDQVTGIEPGQRVMATIYWGGMAEQAVAPTGSVIVIPDDMDFVTASVFQGGHLTSYYALKQRGQLREGETLLVLGAAGGVGTAAVQLGKAMGARVIAAVSSQDKCDFALENGADDTINYSSQNLKEETKALTDGQGADVIFDPVGGEFFDQATRCIAWKGRILVVGFASGAIPKYPVNLALLKGCSIVGVNYMGFSTNEPDEVRQNIVELMQMVEQNKLKPKVDRVFPFDEAIEALSYFNQQQSIGKVVVQIRPDMTAQ